MDLLSPSPGDPVIRSKYARRLIDPANSVAWFTMDFFWLSDLPWPAYAALAVTLGTGGMLLTLPRRRSDDLALNAWMWMNALWLASDLGGVHLLRYAAMATGVLGAVLLLAAIRPSRRHRTTLRRFRKIRTVGR
jgi:hypothetical protein